MKSWMLCCCLLVAALGLYAQPQTDLVDRQILEDRQTLDYPPLREADIFWERKVWRVIDVREKLNLPFSYPAQPLFDILKEEALAGNINLYDPAYDPYQKVFTAADLEDVLARRDTIEIYDLITQLPELKVVSNSIYAEDVNRYRVEEIWYFDSRTSTLKVQIIGLAPMLDVLDENANFIYEKPLFWVNFPESREVLDGYQVYSDANESHRNSWTDHLERRKFASYIYKSPNMRDFRLQDMYSGTDLLLQADRINQEIFNFEHDLWSY